MSRKTGNIFVSIGVVLMILALLLFFYNRYEEQRAGREAELLMNKVQSAVRPQDADSENVPETLPDELPLMMIDGYGYIGFLSIPNLGVNLPVMSEWDYKRLKIAPCRQSGSSRTDDLVIAAHNYKTHFGLLSELESGAEVCFTDMDGMENYYTLSRLETLAPDAVDAVLNSEHDLVLYTCTPGGATRVTAFFDRAVDRDEKDVADE